MRTMVTYRVKKTQNGPNNAIRVESLHAVVLPMGEGRSKQAALVCIQSAERILGQDGAEMVEITGIVLASAPYV